MVKLVVLVDGIACGCIGVTFMERWNPYVVTGVLEITAEVEGP